MLELHVWGPAFSLPSIDAQCLATIAYFAQVVPKAEWSLIASNDLSLSPTKELPVLRNENIWIGGFRNIVDYVAKLSRGEWSLDSGLEGQQKADVIAFSSFIESYGQPLLDLSLFVSSRNYNTVTRPLYSKMLPLPMPYITPPALRSAAKLRTAHLGLSALDVDATEAEEKKKDDQNPIPARLRTPSNSLLSILSSTPEANVLIRLDALASDFLDPLQSLRSRKRFFVGEFATSLDCLAFAYLALALLPDLPSPWLSKCIRAKHPQLSACVHDLQRLFFSGAVTPEDANLGAFANHQLPWMATERPGIGALASTFASALSDKLPLISSLRETKTLQREFDDGTEEVDEEDRVAVSSYVSARRRELWTTAATVAVGLGLFVGFVSYYHVLGVVPLGSGFLGPGAATRDARRSRQGAGGLGQFGEAGEALGALLGPQISAENETRRAPPPPSEEEWSEERGRQGMERLEREWDAILGFFRDKFEGARKTVSGIFGGS